jgi:cytoplasmic iron level regulating protein YaaA (DUF328/UPF0246 family)
MKILLSPAKSINLNRTKSFLTFSLPQFGNETAELIQKLKKLSPKKIAELMSISRDLADLNYERFQNFIHPGEESEQLQPAIFAFSGEVYKGFEADTLTENEIIEAQNQIRILSGLYGVLKPLDLIYPYRLEMGTKFPNTKRYNNLYSFWGNKITNILEKELQENETIINLASAEYSKVIDFKHFRNPVITPVFKEFKNGSYKMVMMYAKNARGVMARYIIRNNLKNQEDLKLFNNDSYQFMENLSTENEWVFVR